MDTREPRGPTQVVVVSTDTAPRLNAYDWSQANVLNSDRVRARAREDARRLLTIHGGVIGADKTEGAALVAALEAYLSASSSA